jgi:hypothetical protein
MKNQPALDAMRRDMDKISAVPWDNGSPCVAPRPEGMVYPDKPAPRHHGYIPDGSGVEWAAYDTGQMEAYARAAWADAMLASHAQKAAAVDAQAEIARLTAKLEAATGALERISKVASQTNAKHEAWSVLPQIRAIAGEGLGHA